MEVKITEYVNDIQGIIDFLKKMPSDIPAHSISTEYVSGAATITIRLPVYNVSLIDCGDHILKDGEPYPQDLIVDLHDCAGLK